MASNDELVAQADIVSLHCPAIPGITVGMINTEFLGKMKSDAVLINTARGNLVVDEDLLAHLDANEGFWYAADAWNNEPKTKEADWDSALAKHDRVFGSHHIGASTKQAETEIGAEVVRILGVKAETGDIDVGNWVNQKGFAA